MARVITLELRDLLLESWEAAGRDEIGERAVPTEATFDRFLEELQARIARADKAGRDWRGVRP